MADTRVCFALVIMLCSMHLFTEFHFSSPFSLSQTAAQESGSVGVGGQWGPAWTRCITGRETAPPPASPSVPDGPLPRATPGPPPTRKARPPTPQARSHETPACLSGAAPITPLPLVSPALMTCVMYVSMLKPSFFQILPIRLGFSLSLISLVSVPFE